MTTHNKISTLLHGITPPAGVTTIIFDFGGTIDNDGSHWAQVLYAAYNHAGIDIEYDAFWEAYVFAERRLGSENIIQPTFTFEQVLAAKLNLQFEKLAIHNPAAMQKALDFCMNIVTTNVAKLRPTLASLSSNFTLAIVSNFYGNLESVLANLEILNYFTMVIDSDLVGIRKPDSAIFALAIKRLNCRPEQVLVVGDSLKNDITPAQTLGVHTLHLIRP